MGSGARELVATAFPVALGEPTLGLMHGVGCGRTVIKDRAMADAHDNCQKILWHEWRHSLDEDHKKELAKIVRQLPVGSENSLRILGDTFAKVELVERSVLV